MSSNFVDDTLSDDTLTDEQRSSKAFRVGYAGGFKLGALAMMRIMRTRRRVEPGGYYGYNKPTQDDQNLVQQNIGSGDDEKGFCL